MGKAELSGSTRYPDQFGMMAEAWKTVCCLDLASYLQGHELVQGEQGMGGQEVLDPHGKAPGLSRSDCVGKDMDLHPLFADEEALEAWGGNALRGLPDDGELSLVDVAAHEHKILNLVDQASSCCQTDVGGCHRFVWAQRNLLGRDGAGLSSCPLVQGVFHWWNKSQI